MLLASSTRRVFTWLVHANCTWTSPSLQGNIQRDRFTCMYFFWSIYPFIYSFSRIYGIRCRVPANRTEPQNPNRREQYRAGTVNHTRTETNRGPKLTVEPAWYLWGWGGRNNIITITTSMADQSNANFDISWGWLGQNGITSKADQSNAVFQIFWSWLDQKDVFHWISLGWTRSE